MNNYLCCILQQKLRYFPSLSISLDINTKTIMQFAEK